MASACINRKSHFNRDKRAWNVGGMVRETTCRVGDGLIVAGNEYEFRVVAINKGGESANSPTSKSVLAKNRFVKPKINKDVLAVDRTVHAGQVMKVELEITGEPKPELVVTSPEGGMLRFRVFGQISQNRK